MLKFVVDTHTHSSASGHAYSSIQEMAKGAFNNGIKMIALTEHGPTIPGAPNLIYFSNFKVVPKEIYGVKILKGAEANIINFQGGLDIPDDFLKRLDFKMAGFHDICIEPSTIEENTNAMIYAMMNPYIDGVVHPGNPKFQVDIAAVVKAAKKYNKLIEINNHSFEARPGSENNCKEFALRCKEQRVTIVCGSDAHICFDIGKFENVYDILKEVDFPEELIINTSVEKVMEFLNKN